MALLEAKKLGISFGGLRAVDDFNISIEKGALYGLIGPNGAGKTTVFNLLTGVYKPTEGIITLDGKDITGKKTIDINQAGIARTFQNIRLFKDLSVIETQELMDTIRFVREHFDMTILLIEHDMKLVSGICEELTVLNFGRVLCQGKTSDVLNNPEVIKAYLGE